MDTLGNCGDPTAARSGKLGTEGDLAQFAALGVAHAIKSGRIRTLGLHLAHHVHQLDLLSSAEQVKHRLFEIGLIDEEIRNQDHHACWTALQEHFADRRGKPRLTRALQLGEERFERLILLAPAVKRRRSAASRRRARDPNDDDAHRVILGHPDVRKRRGERACEAEFIVALRKSPSTRSHRASP